MLCSADVQVVLWCCVALFVDGRKSELSEQSGCQFCDQNYKLDIA